MNNIQQKQNTEPFLRLLSAQRYSYHQAKKILIIRFSLSLLFAIIGPLLILNFAELSTYVAITAVAYLLVDVLVLRNIENNFRTNGAKIQEEFDTGLFELGWNEICTGNRIDQELICDYSNKYKAMYSDETLLNWYPQALSQLTLKQAIIICQRTNTWWDSALRKSMGWFTEICLTTLTIAVFYLFSKDSNILFTVLFSLLPLYEIALDYIRSQITSIQNISELKTKTEGKIENVLDGVEPTSEELRSIQDQIFRNRSTALFVPEWFYFFFRDKQEMQMNHSAEHYVNAILGE